MRLLITGVSGLLGINTAWEALQAGHEVIGWVNRRMLPRAPFPTRSIDLTDATATAAAWDEAKPEAVIHCAALANLDECERNPQYAHVLNAEAAGRLAALAKRDGVAFVHISTDAVFDGKRGGYTENDTPNPLSVYARSKLMGEERVLAANPQAFVARVNLFGWSLSGRRSLAEWFLNNLRAGKQMRGFTDVFFCPLLANHLARLLFEALERGLHGLYHLVAADCMSKYEFGVLLARRFGLDASLIKPSSVENSGLSAARAHNLTLRADKFAAAVNHTIPTIEDGVEEFHRQALNQYPETLREWLNP